jgi:hypothetical protein
MEPEGSLPCSEEASIGPYPGPVSPVRTTPYYLSMKYFNIIHPSVSSSS